MIFLPNRRLFLRPWERSPAPAPLALVMEGGAAWPQTSTAKKKEYQKSKTLLLT
jgi:hypothetical protein